MSELLYFVPAKFIRITELDGTPYQGWQDEYLHASGILGIYMSEHLAPGQIFLNFFTPEPDSDKTRFLKTSVGMFEKDNDGYICFVSKHHKYFFEALTDPDDEKKDEMEHET